MLKADGSIGDGFRAGTGGPEPDCPWATPLERSCSPGRTVGECARQAQSGARASCCTRSWVLRGLGSCRRLPSPQNTEQQCSGKVTGIEARHRTSVYQTQLPRATRVHRFKGRGRLSGQPTGDVQIGRECHGEHPAGDTSCMAARKPHKRERGASEGKTQRPEACRSARVPIEMPRIQNPRTGARFPARAFRPTISAVR